MASSMQSLKLNIEAGLRSMADEAKQKLDDDLAMGIVSPEERERLVADHHATLRTMRKLAEDQFRIALERERQERRWAAGEQLDPAWSESMMKEQQAILDKIEREKKKKKDTLPSFGFDTPPPVQFPLDSLPESATPTPVPSVLNRKPDRLSRTPTQLVDPKQDGSHYFSSHSLHYERDELAASPNEIPSFRNTRKVRDGSITPTGSWKAPSIIDTNRSFLDCSKPESMSRPARDDPIPKENIRRTSIMNARPIMQEFWKPPITPEEDAQKSRTFTLAGRSSTASATSSSRASSALAASFSDPLDSLDRAQERDRSRSHYETRLEKGSRPVHSHFEEDGSNDAFDNRGYYNERHIRDIAEGLRKREDAVDRREEELARKEYEARRKQEGAERKDEEVRRRTKEINIKAEETQKKEEELRKREEELRRREDDLKRRESEMRRREDGGLQVEFRTREEEIPRQRAGERKSKTSRKPG